MSPHPPMPSTYSRLPSRLRSRDSAAGTCPCVCRRVYVPTAPVPVPYMRVRYMVRYNSSVLCTIQRIAMHVRIPSIVRAELRANTFGHAFGPCFWPCFWRPRSALHQAPAPRQQNTTSGACADRGRITHTGRLEARNTHTRQRSIW